MHALTVRADEPAVMTRRAGNDAATKLNLRVENAEVRSARRAVAAYLTACGIREPDAVARHTGRVVTGVVQDALVRERRVPVDAVVRALRHVADEYLRTTEAVVAETAGPGVRTKAVTPTHARAILGALPDVWAGDDQTDEGKAPALAKAADYLGRTGGTIVPPESRRLMSRPAFDGAGSTWLVAVRQLTRRFARVCGRPLAAAERLLGRHTPQAS